ncbi:MAG: hypothetical protein DI616_00265 [Paracoccus denitrificans]|uniref:Transmembrane protein n=1 Tax=Paracoccus denitrificans TaxID=266 RepID=A0A533IC88_PARDE|nr:MAG: hypothetical protein DI616_00265 [Paracoccus denitrificans]
MSLPPDRPIFLERAAYRRRRLQDAARLLPVVTLIALLVPVWLMPAALSGAGGMVLLFALWTLVILCSGLLHRRLRRPQPSRGRKDEL